VSSTFTYFRKHVGHSCNLEKNIGSISDLNIIIYQLFIQQKVVKPTYIGPTIGSPLDQNQMIKQSKLITFIQTNLITSLLTNENGSC
jgi:hypothetical protein